MDRQRRLGSRRLAAAATVVALAVGLAAPGGVLATPVPGAQAAALSATGQPDAPTKVIVRFRARPGAAGERAIERAGGTVRFHYTIVPALAATVPLAAIAGLRHNPNVAAIEIDGHLTAFDHGGATGDLEYENAWGVEHIGSKPVHEAGIRGDGIRVAVIDTGIDYIHNLPAAQEPPVVDPEFNGSYRGGYDFVNLDDDPLDDNGHGTHVSGILAADHNGYLVAGVAPEVELYALKVLGATGEGDYSGLIAALDWAVENEIDVVNMSLGGHDVSATLQAAVEAAADAGIVLVAAAGNVNPLVWQELFYGCAVAFPAAYPDVLATTFTNGSDALTGYSCTGAAVDFAAPGDQVFSPVPVGPAGSCMFCSPNGYSAQSGTSMASPHLAGLVALVLDHGIADSDGDGLLMPEIRAHLCANTVPGTRAFSGWPYAHLYGCGVINARKALIENPPPLGTGAPVAVDDEAVTVEDAPTDIDVLANDSDPQGDSLAVTAVSAAAHGATSINPNGTVRYAPVADYHGPDTFTYTVGDGQGHASTATVSVSVTPVNDPPAAGPDSLVTARDVPATIDVLANDTDADGDPLAVTAVTAPTHGSVAFTAGGSVTYTPAADYSGPDAFRLHGRRWGRRLGDGKRRRHGRRREPPADRQRGRRHDGRGHGDRHRRRGQRHGRRRRCAHGRRGDPATQRLGGDRPQRDGHVSTGAGLPRARRIHLHGPRRGRRECDGFGGRDRDPGERRPGGGRRRGDDARGHAGHPGPGGERHGRRRRRTCGRRRRHAGTGRRGRRRWRDRVHAVPECVRDGHVQLHGGRWRRGRG